MTMQIKPKDSAETPEYSKKLSQNVSLQTGIRHYEGDTGGLCLEGLAGLTPRLKGRTFCCHCLSFSIQVPTEICTVRDVFEPLPEYVLCHLYNITDMTPQNIEFKMRMLDRDIEYVKSNGGGFPGASIPVIASSYIDELTAEKERLDNDLDFCKWWQGVKDTPLGEAVKTELVKLVRQKRAGEETVVCEVKDK